MPTPRQQEALDAIIALTAERGFPPTVREVAARLGIWHSAVSKLLASLKEEGLVTWEEGQNRTLVVLRAG